MLGCFLCLVAGMPAGSLAFVTRVAGTPLTSLKAVPTLPEGKNNFAFGVLGDLHVDPRDMDDTYEAREHIKAALGEEAGSKFVVSLGDLGESKDCTGTGELFSGTSACFELIADYLGGMGVDYDIVGGNHDLEGIDEFATDKDNLEAYLKAFDKEQTQFCVEVAPKTLLVGLGSTQFRDATYTSHEVAIDAEQYEWFVNVVETHPADDDWKIIVFSHAPIIGSGLRVLQEVHVVNGCCWLNHNDNPQRYIELVRQHPQIKGWFSGHFHLSHDYEDSITFPGGNNRGSCVFVQTGVMRSKSSRDGRRHTRLVRGNEHGFEICTINHNKGGEVRLDATVSYNNEDTCVPGADYCSTLVYAHAHQDYNHDAWFSAYQPEKDDGCYVVGDIVNANGEDLSEIVCWWHMRSSGKEHVLGVHNGMIIEYDPSTLAPLGMVVSKDELKDRKVAVIDDGYGGDTLILYEDGKPQATVVQPNEDGSFWRKVVRNKMHRMKEMRRVAAAKKFIKDVNLNEDDKEPEVLSSYGPYKTTAGQVMGISTKALNSKAEALATAAADAAAAAV